MTSPADQLRALIRYRIDPARDTLGEAEILLESIVRHIEAEGYLTDSESD